MKKPTPTSGVPVEIFGETHSLRFKAQGIIDVERKTGLSFLRNAQQIFQSISMELTCDLLAAGLKHEMPDITPEQIAAVVDLEELVYYSERISEAFRRAFPAPAAVAKAEPTPIRSEPAEEVRVKEA